MTGDSVPIGRRVAYLRARRKLSQQSFADRLGKSKSWVDKVERGVRSLERVSTIRQIAAVLRVDAATLLGRDARPAEVAERAEGVSRIRAALSTYGIALGRPVACRDASPDEWSRAVEHAWTTYQHARYPQLMQQLPTLLSDLQRVQAQGPDADRTTVVEVYRVTAALLVKLDEASLAWLAADRAMSAAMGDQVLLACAAVQLGQVLRASARAKSVMLAAAYRIAPPDLDDGTPQELSLCGSLLVQGALMAARAGNDRAAGDLLDEAVELAARVGDGNDHHHTAFGPTAVDLARLAAAIELGDGTGAVTQHETAIERDGWRWLPLEHRAAHLVDAAPAYLQVGNVIEAARNLVLVDNLAPSEIRHRPAARRVVAEVAQQSDAPTTITDLANGLGLV
ncbi:helix-turn-helix domain-containing protein [Micromonospora sp. KC721]|uniref:helix-turn-helix domain-containing protein n=1 Tax=Micromonospora sp. KC721 TaxID=2530380 RepID=UPI00104DA45C|nr:helix-turn-helix domain-containing protein [Micromonospora sp. KC721]TDB82359.1 XRE family transcriptional regulator [Micromonospora sp. KC721]